VQIVSTSPLFRGWGYLHSTISSPTLRCLAIIRCHPTRVITIIVSMWVCSLLYHTSTSTYTAKCLVSSNVNQDNLVFTAFYLWTKGIWICYPNQGITWCSHAQIMKRTSCWMTSYTQMMRWSSWHCHIHNAMTNLNCHMHCVVTCFEIIEHAID